MTAQIDSLVDELERSYAEAQERMNDPALYSDRNAAAGRRKAPEGARGPAQAGAGMARGRDDAEAARADPTSASSCPSWRSGSSGSRRT